MTDPTQPFTPPIKHRANPEWQALFQRFCRVDPEYLRAQLARQSGAHGELVDLFAERRPVRVLIPFADEEVSA